MIILIIALLVISIYGISFVKFNEHYLDYFETTSIKGIFIIFVFLSHSCSYLDKMMISDITYNLFRVIFSSVGQLMVVMFFFYSGFGVMESMKKKDYLYEFPKKRIISTTVHFWYALLFYLCLNVLLKIYYPIKVYLLSIFAWENIGNSNWYVFDIIILYWITYISFRFVKSEEKAILTIFISVPVLAFILRIAGKNTTWYNTIICYPIGMLFSYNKNNIKRLFQGKLYYFGLLILTIIFLACYNYSNIITHLIIHPVFALIIVLVTMKIHVGNKILFLLGHNLFPIYILQRIPMIVLYKLSFLQNGIIYVLLCMLLTFCLTVMFKTIVKKVDLILLNR